MREKLVVLLTGCLMLSSCTGPQGGAGEESDHGHDEFHSHMVEKVSFQEVTITDNFWQPKIEINRVSSIRHALEQASQSIGYFDIAAGNSDAEHKGNLASDSDVYKIIQGAAYALYHTPDKELEAIIDSVINRIVAAQQPDGYLFTYWIVHDLSQQWTDIERKHELYCAGHLFEAAAAYYQVTGKRKLLDAAKRFADHIDSIFGPGKRLDVPGHEEIELALYSLYEVTGEKRYLDLSIFFIDERGNPERIADALIPPDHDPRANSPGRWRHPSYRQDHLPVTEQYYAIGHAVRAGYLYSSMVDITMETRDAKYLRALDSIWNDIVRKKLYITGGIGTRQFHDEGFGTEYLLPNDQAYCETCSGIALTFWNRRMNLLHGDAKYADLTELTMYNSGISGVSLSGDRFFYSNPLESEGKHSRRVWFNPPCCPSNVVRFLPEIGSTIYGKTDQAIYINQFIGSETSIELADHEVALTLESGYPWDGEICLKVDPEAPVDFTLFIRIPGWAQGELIPGGLYHYFEDETLPEEEVILKVNGKRIRKIHLEKGYAVIKRKWKKGDRVEVELPMNVRLVAGNPRIEDAHGKIVLMRGPMVYCVEEADNEGYFEQTSEVQLLPSGLKEEHRDDLLGGVVTINGTASLLTSGKEFDFTAIPYYAWSNRGQGQMKVWLPAPIPKSGLMGKAEIVFTKK
ncbi:MAG: glycoside hydrolase family 127 protein [Bacteroidetes bacterium]|nr:glycoside hydrolase family 127 protein [Bacteroidota bacterium]